jgi:hypothetical protein
MAPAHEMDKISSAVHDCLDPFSPDRSVVRQVAGRIKRLRRLPGWTRDEVDQVKRAVRRILAVLGTAGWGSRVGSS